MLRARIQKFRNGGGGGGGREKLFVAHDYGALNITCVGRGREDHTSPKIVEKRFVNS